MDYLLRDSYLAGLPYGRYQIDRLITSMTFGFDSSRIPQIAIDPSRGLHPAIELLRGRMTLHRVLYRHRTVQGMEQLLAKLLERLRDLARRGTTAQISSRSAKPLLELIQGKQVPIDQLVSLDDHSMWVLIAEISDARFDVTASNLALRILHRDPLRSVRLPSEEIRRFLNRADAHDRIQDTIAKYVPGDPQYYYHVGSEEFRLLERSEAQRALYIDTTGVRTALALREHPALRAERIDETVDLGHELLVPREATGDVRAVVRSNPSTLAT